MPDSFDPYQQWLAIPPSEQPPDYYRLLGLEPFESDRGIISRAVRGRIDHVRKLAADQRPELMEKIVKELSAARHCLLTPRLRESYEAQLRGGETEAQEAAPVPANAVETTPPAVESADHEDAGGADLIDPPTIVVNRPSPAQAAPLAASPRSRKATRWPIVLGATGGSMLAVVLALFFVGGDSSDQRSANDQRRRPGSRRGSQPQRGWRPQGPETMADLMNRTDDLGVDVNTVTGMLEAARTAMADGAFHAAANHLRAANLAAATPTERTEIKRVEALLESLRDFWSAVQAEVKSLDVDDTIVSGQTTLTVIRTDNRELRLRGPQRSYRCTTDNLPAKLAVVLAERHLVDKDAALCNLHVGSFHAVDPRGDRQEARRRWQEAGPEGKALLGELRGG